MNPETMYCARQGSGTQAVPPAAHSSPASSYDRPRAKVRAGGPATGYSSRMLAPKVKPPPKAHSPTRSPFLVDGRTSFRQSGMLEDDVFPYF